MPRKLRVEYAGAIYHLINRGDRREPIFLHDRDRELFIKTLGETCKNTGWQIHAYCLMKNHFHLVAETPRANLVSGMRWLLGTYTTRFNLRHKYCGHLFSGRYKSMLVDGSGTGYLKTVCDYTHLNPVRSKELTPEQRLEEYRWSSWPEYLKRPGKRVPWLRVDRLHGEWGVTRDNALGRNHLRHGMEVLKKLAWARENSEWAELRRGWCWGSESFRDAMLERIDKGKGRQHFGAELRESEEQRAERLIKEMLQKAGVSLTELKQRRKAERKKVEMASNLREQTTMTWVWIARRLQMGHWRTAANAVRREAKHTNSQL